MESESLDVLDISIEDVAYWESLSLNQEYQVSDLLLSQAEVVQIVVQALADLVQLQVLLYQLIDLND